VLERGHKAHGYVAAGDASKIPIGCPPMTTRLSDTGETAATAARFEFFHMVLT